MMKLMISHDSQGNIAALVVCPPDSTTGCLITQPGQRVTEVEMPELTDDLNSDQLGERLSGLIENFQVDKGVLKKKS